ncbi:hypothetical protein AVEN_224001-1 [Araneus ventricosus]|uniref:Uncharacterized protein n=1 Tax=Araneus ventricosus TaxID=182803 RepID=A0A4Y2UX41_ARAVE|nr:hypothetical protein AVEN_224001-1 [Araneus ventricosus]
MFSLRWLSHSFLCAGRHARGGRAASRQCHVKLPCASMRDKLTAGRRSADVNEWLISKMAVRAKIHSRIIRDSREQRAEQMQRPVFIAVNNGVIFYFSTGR